MTQIHVQYPYANSLIESNQTQIIYMLLILLFKGLGYVRIGNIPSSSTTIKWLGQEEDTSVFWQCCVGLYASMY